MSYPGKSYLEHVAVRVYDIHWHIRFFREVLGMPLRECDGPTDNPRRWTMGCAIGGNTGLRGPAEQRRGLAGALRNHGRRPRGGAEGSGQLGRQELPQDPTGCSCRTAWRSNSCRQPATPSPRCWRSIRVPEVLPGAPVDAALLHGGAGRHASGRSRPRAYRATGGQAGQNCYPCLYRSVTKAFEPPPGPLGRVPANHRQPKARHGPNGKSQGLDPGLRRGDESWPAAEPELAARHDNLPAMAKPSRQWLSASAAPSAARGRRELSRRCLTAGRVSTRPAGRGRSEEPARAGAAAGRFSASFLCRHKKGGRPPGRDPANHRQPKAPQDRSSKDQNTGPRPAPGRRIVAGCRARIGGTARQPPGNGEAEPAVAFRFCSVECSPRPAEIVASMSEPAGRVSTRPADCGRSEGTGESRRCGRGAFASFLCRHKKGGRPPGETRPITANRRHPKIEAARIKTLDPGLRRGDESWPAAEPELAARHDNLPAMAKPSRRWLPLLQRRVQPAAGGNCRVDV